MELEEARVHRRLGGRGGDQRGVRRDQLLVAPLTLESLELLENSLRGHALKIRCDPVGRSILRLHGRVALAIGAPAAGAFVAIVDADPDLDDLIAVGVTTEDGSFRASFTTEAFNQEPGEKEAWPDLYVVVSVVRDGALTPIVRKDFGKLVLDHDVDIGTIVVPELPTPGLRGMPGRGKLVKRLRLDEELVDMTAREVAAVVEKLTGWSELRSGVRFAIVDDFLDMQREKCARMLGRSDFTSAELAEITAAAGECDSSAFALWSPASSTVFLNRPLIEAQSLDFLSATLGHELVHVGQSRAHPQLDVEVTSFQREVWTNAPVDVDVRTSRIQLMTNIEGYAHYIETRYLRRIYTHAEHLGHAARAVDARLRRARAPQTKAFDLAASPEELLLLARSTKDLQYQAGDEAYAARSTGETPARFDPQLRPELGVDPYVLLAVLPAVARATLARALFERTPTTVGDLATVLGAELGDSHVTACLDGELVIGPPLVSPVEKVVARWAPGARVSSLDDLRARALANGWSVELAEGRAVFDAILRKMLGEPRVLSSGHEYSRASGVFVLSWDGVGDRCTLSSLSR